MTTETMQEAPPTLWCDNPAHAEEGIPVTATYRTTWPDGRFKPASACEDCLDEALRFYVLDDDMDGRLHPVLVELAGASPVTDELAKLRGACRTMGKVITGMARSMEAARIEMLQNGPEAAMQWILNSIPDVDDNDPGDQWNGTETAAQWLDRQRAGDRAAEAATS